MADRDRLVVLTDAQWAALEPLIEACRPRGKTQHHDLRRTIEAIIWRHDNGAKWRSIPPELGPWWMAAQTFNRWGHLGVWERLLEAAQAGPPAEGLRRHPPRAQCGRDLAPFRAVGVAPDDRLDRATQVVMVGLVRRAARRDQWCEHLPLHVRQNTQPVSICHAQQMGPIFRD